MPGRKLLRLAGCLLLVLIAACGSDPEPQGSGTKDHPTPAGRADTGPAYGDALVTGTIGDASNLIPALASDSASHAIIDLVYSPLVKIDKNLNLSGDLATHWDVSEDGRTVTFHLREGVRWHDGRPFTAKDCLFTYQVMVDPKTPTAYAEQFKQIERAEALDDHTFEVRYKRPFARALITWGLNIMPAHLLAGKDITTSPLARHPIGTGPYRFKLWETGQKIVLEANSDYYGGPPYVTRRISRIIPDTATMFMELKSGAVDRMPLTPDQYQRLTGQPGRASGFNTYKYLDFGYTYLGFNLRDPRFQDKRVRQAISHAIDKTEIIKGVLLGLGRPANGPYKPGHWAYNPKVTPYPYDKARARELLAEAGWRDSDGDGVIDRDGIPFAFTIMTNQGNKQREMTALIIQQRLKEVGIRVKVRTVEWAAFLKEFIDKKKFEALVMGWNIPIDPDLFNVWHSSKTRAGELNFISFKNDEVDRLLDEGRFTLDRAERKAAYDHIQEILREEAPYVFLYVPEALPAVAARFHGISPAPAGIDYNIAQWYVPQGLQKYQFTP